MPNGTFFLSVDGSSGSFGTVTNAVSLGGVPVGANGTITIILDPVNIGECAGRVYDPGTTLVFVDDAFSVTGGQIEDPAEAESFLVVFAPGGVSDGQDIDVDNDEVIDAGLGITVVDGFAVTVNNSLQAAYAPIIYDAFTATGGTSAELPDAAARCPNLPPTPLSALVWRYGELTGADNAPGPFGPPTNSSGYTLTPGGSNNACP
jgi:hypothetical protein